jgi:glutaminyl-peptide cyclotransferase
MIMRPSGQPHRAALLTMCVASLLTACGQATTATLQPELVRVLPHDPAAYTQGLLLHEGRLYESTGQYGSSSVREVDPETGAVLRVTNLPEQYFGEGLALVGERLIQLTWKEQVAFVYDLHTLALRDTLHYEGEGWGLCYDGDSLFMTNGGSTLFLRDPDSFRITDRRTITLGGVPLSRVNELECVGDDIYANVYLTDLIVRIDKATANVVAVFDAANLTAGGRPANPDAVLNGIAWDGRTGTFYITGKLWPTLYQVRLVEDSTGR